MSKFNIPKTFSLMGTFYTVEESPILVHNDDNLGQASYRNQTIILQQDCIGSPISDNEQLRVFCHELMHHIFHVLRETELRDNEKVVDNVGSLIHQFLITQEGRLKK